MKAIIVLCFVALALQYEAVHGGLVKGFFDGVHETAQKVKEDIGSIINPTRKSVTTTEEDVDSKSDTSVTSSTPSAPVTPKASEETTTSSTTAPSVTTSTIAPATNKTDDKDGRENFKAGCATGYQRTADGRCKPTF